MSDHLHFISILLEMALFFSISGIIVPIFQRFKISPILGYLICGVLFTPSNMAVIANWVPWTQQLIAPNHNLAKIIGELGIIILMFMIVYQIYT